jgi:glycosyltransferase involved in cell wall biosynthesis
MKITVILCTYNRYQSLVAALESILASNLPSAVEWEVLIVDNNSRDQTRRVAKEFCHRFPAHFRYLFEPNQGLSQARNAGIQEARGGIIAFTDDDVTVEPSWLENLVSPLDDNKWSGTAGRIRLGAEFSPPPWLAVRGAFNLGGALAQFDEGETQAELTRAPFGANMAFRKCVFENYGNFRTDLGRNGGSLIGREDTEFCERLLTAGEHICYVPSAVVNHPVRRERLTKKYFRSYWFAQGRSSARQAGKRLSIWSIPRRCLKEFKQGLKWMFSLDRRWFLSPQGRFFCEAQLLQAAGEIVESSLQSFRVVRSRKATVI